MLHLVRNEWLKFHVASTGTYPSIGRQSFLSTRQPRMQWGRWDPQRLRCHSLTNSSRSIQKSPNYLKVSSPAEYLTSVWVRFCSVTVIYVHIYRTSFLETQDSKEARKSFTVRKPAVPARTDNPIMGLQTKRDFIKTTTAVTMKPKPTSVDSRNGHKQLLENSGLVPKYIKKKVFLSTTLHTKKNVDIFCLTVAYVWEHIPPLYWSIPGPWL